MQTLLDPAILFFVFGAAAGLVRSNLEIPQPIARFLSLYLLMALGLKGGFALAESGLTREVGVSLACAVLLAVAIPAIGYNLLRRWLSGFDAAAVAATYGSVSAVTFITAVQVLDGRGMEHGGHMAAAMALMESPAIIMAVLLANMLRRQQAAAVVPPGSVSDALMGTSGLASAGAGPVPPLPIGKVLHESFTDGAQLLLLGAMAVGLATGDSGQAAMKPFSGDLFKGMLAFFLLDMGLLTARHLHTLSGMPRLLLAWGVLAPLAHAGLALGLAAITGMGAGNAALLMVLAASASYIAVPAVLRHAVPEAQPALYFGLSLGVTFPFNILLGIPLYLSVAQWALKG
ncbi:MAG: sodium-dependent bicarbonate transport family permease [Betaproteobacteria bacterium]|nr:sodium-dependent bicarbonate transport family permease [Betaproteobacteria bacterium]NBT10889.1 sodium-dependent bicarbonate transport family permease [Betaproteobacteria bacterium]NBU49796.1 sodium-dependent bicarbonate transport family permease [Betaproteobacteria bacterium]NBX97069.1 sodium-dependent bicarbonate transport family permease [Betaproteobacteria bacterium]